MSDILLLQEIARRVRPYVINRHIGDISLQIDDARIHLRNGYWNIPYAPLAGTIPYFHITKHSLRLKTKFRKTKA